MTGADATGGATVAGVPWGVADGVGVMAAIFVPTLAGKCPKWTAAAFCAAVR